MALVERSRLCVGGPERTMTFRLNASHARFPVPIRTITCNAGSMSAKAYSRQMTETSKLRLDRKWVWSQILCNGHRFNAEFYGVALFVVCWLTSIRLAPQVRDIAREPVSVLALQLCARSQSHSEREEASL